jgi:hypothetical protein
LYNQGNTLLGGFRVNASLSYSSVLLVVASLAVGAPADAHGPSGHHESMTAAQGEEAMKAQHARMGKFEEAMVALDIAVIHGDKADTGKHAGRLTEALQGYEKDVPHENVSRIKEFRAFYGEMKKRAVKLAADAGTGNLQKTALSYGKVLELCASCHAIFRN